MTLHPRTRTLILAIAIPAAACDPGYRYRPIGWMEQAEHQWTRDFHGFSLRTRVLQGLVGHSRLHLSFEVVGNSEPVRLKEAALQTASTRHAGIVDSQSASVPPGGGVLHVDWKFENNRPVPETLGGHAEIVLEFVLGSRVETVRIDYERVACCD